MKPGKHLPLILCCLCASLLAATAVHAQGEKDKPKKPAKLFSSDEALSVTMKAPWRDLVAKERYKGSYPATIEYIDENGQTVSLDMTVERRGIKRQEVCRFPPVKLRFEKEKVKGTAFRGQKSIKLVTHCERASRYEQYYVLEMLAYHIYNLITDYSFRIRVLDINYVDSKTGKENSGMFGFLIEDDSDVAKRHDLKKLVIPRIRSKRLDQGLASEFSQFQYLIGNVDWAALSGPDKNECCHNVKLIAKEPLQEGDPIYPIPYDFDSSGLVNAIYAAPPAGLPIKKVTQRLYRGYCSHNATMDQARQKILGLENDILALVNNESLLNSSRKKSAVKYLERGFKVLKDPKDYERLIMEKCRK